MNRPFPSSPEPLYQNVVKCSAFYMELIFHSHANKTHFHKKGCALGLILKVMVFGTGSFPYACLAIFKRNIRELSNDDGDVNENGKKAKGLE